MQMFEIALIVGAVMGFYCAFFYFGPGVYNWLALRSWRKMNQQ